MSTVSLARLSRGGAAALLVALVVACQPDDLQDQGVTQPSNNAPTASLVKCEGPAECAEGEIFGSIYDDEELTSSFEGQITLDRIGPGSVSNFSPDLIPSSSYPLMWEFWDIAGGDGPCSLTPNRGAETGHASPPSPDYEQHCVRPGTYEFTGPSATGSGTISFEVDYLQAVTGANIDDNTTGAAHPTATVMRTYTELDNLEANYVGGYFDLVINRDVGSTSYSDTPVLDIDASSSPHSTDFANVTSPSGSSTDWFRFVVGRSTSTWSPADAPMNLRGDALAKIWYRETGTSTWLAATNYYDYSSSGGVVRKRQFAGPGSCPASPRSWDVGLEIMRPDENPASGPTTTRTISVTCTGAPPAVAAPTVTAVSGVAPTTATINWNNGTSTSGVTTEIDTMRSGGSWGTLVSGRPVGSATTYGLTGLTPSTTYSVRIRHDSAGVKSAWDTESPYFTTTGVTVSAPTIGSTTSITHNSATVNWTNGTTSTGVTTRIEYGPMSYSLNVSGIAAGVTSRGLTSLSASSTYWVRVRHDSAGIPSTWSSSTFVTEPPDDPPTFSQSNCSRYFASGKWRIIHELSWTQGGGSWQIREATTNDSTAGSVVLSGGSGSSTWTGEYLEMYGPLYSYFWVKLGSGPWVPLTTNPLETTSCEA